MVNEKAETSFPKRKISETFLDFAEPLLLTEGRRPTKEQIETVLKVAFTVWNSVVLDTANSTTHYTKELRKLVARKALLVALVEQMISRKQTVFGDDLRLIGEYKFVKKNGEWRLWAEARKPKIGL